MPRSNKSSARRRLALSGAIAGVLGGMYSPARAATFVLNANDAVGASSFSSSGGWSSGAAPASGNTYEVTGTTQNNYLLRTPADGNNYTFSGDVLQLDSQSRFILKGNAANTITVNNLILNGGLIDFSPTTAGLETLAGGISLASGTTSTILAEVAGQTLTISAPITGAGNVTFGAGAAGVTGVSAGNNAVTGIAGAGTLTLNAAETYTGITILSGGLLNLNGANGALTGTSGLSLFGGTLTLDNSSGTLNNTNRINDSATVALSGGNFVLKGNATASTNSSETVGAMSGLGGSVVTVSFGGSNTATLTATSLSHSLGNGSILVNGASLGKDSASTASVARFFVNTAPTLVGNTAALATGINSAAKDTMIVPFLVGEAAPGTGGLGTATNNANTFVTYNATTGFRPLNPTDEFTQNAITTGTNTRITAATASTANASINSLLMNGANLTITDGTTLTVASGAVLFASNSTIAPSTSTGALGFGSAEGMITAANGVTGTISASLTGTGGITFGGAGTVTVSTGTVVPLGGITGGIFKSGSGTTNINTTTASFLPAASTNTINVEGGTLAFTSSTSTTFTNPLGTGQINITPGATLFLSLAGNTASTFANAISIANANPEGLAVILDNSGATPFSGGLNFAAGSFVPTLQLKNTNSTTAALAISGGITGVGNIQFNGTAAGSPITLSGAVAVNNTGSLVNIGAGNNANSTVTISAPIGSNVTSITQSSSNPFTITGAITLGGDRLYANLGTANLTMGAITGTAAASNTQTITYNVTNTGQIINSGVIGDGAGGGKVAVSLIGVGAAGVTAFAGASTYSGGTTVNTGSIAVPQVNSTGPAGAPTNGAFGTGLLTLAGGGIRSSTGGAFSVGNTVSITADTSFPTAGANTDTSLTFTGPVTLTGTRLLTVSTSPAAGQAGIFFSGAIAGAGGAGGTDGITKAGAGELFLSGASTYGGVTAINAGVLSFQTPASLPNYTSQASGRVTVAANATASFAVGGTGGFSATDLNNLAGGTIPINFAAGSYLGLDTTSATGGAATVSNSFGSLPANAGLAKTGNGTLTLSGSNTYGGNTLVEQGTLIAADGTGLSPNTNLAIASISTANPATFDPIGTFSRPIGTGAGAVQITGGVSGFTNLTAASQTIGITGQVVWGAATFNPTALLLNPTGATNALNLSAAIDFASASRTVEVDATGAALAATLSGVLSSSTGGAAGGITKTGNGILNVTGGSNTYGGLSQVNAGTLSFNGTGALPSGSQISLNGGTFQVLNDGTGTVNYGNAVGVLANTAFNVGNNGGGTTGATFAFGAFSAPTTAAATSTTTTFSSNNGDTISFNGTTALSLAGAGGSTTTLIANTPVVFNGNVLNRETGFTAGQFDTIALQGTSTGTINGVIADVSGGGSLAGGTTPVTKTGTGTWILSGLNTYQGATQVQGGTLELLGAPGGTPAAGAGSLILKASGSTNASNVGTLVNGGGTLAIVNNVVIGDGTTNAATNTGTLTVGTGSSGTLSLQDGGINSLTVQGSSTTGATTFLTLGGAAGQVASINLDLGNSTTDQIFVTASISGSGKLVVGAGGAVINLNQLASTAIGTGTYPLINFPAGGTFTGAFSLGTYTPPAGEFFSLVNTGTAEQLVVTTGAGAVNAYFQGAVNSVWNAGAGTTTTNFTTDFAGTQASNVPDPSTNVFISTTNATAANLNTSLGQTLTINSLSFAGTGAAGTPTSAGTSVTVGGTNALTIAAAAQFTDQNGTVYAAGTGLVDQAGSATHTISAPVVLGASQAWEIDASNALTDSGAISGNFTLTKTGTGSLILGGVNTFSGGLVIANGIVIANVSNATTVSGAAGPSADAVTLGNSTNAASLLANSFTVSNAINLAAGATGTLTIGNNGATTAAVFSGPIALNGDNLTITSSGTGSTTVTGGITGVGGLALNPVGTTSTLTLSTNPINNAGSITTSGASTGTITISSAIGGAVTGITANSASAPLTITSANPLYTGTTTVTAGTLNANAATAGNTFTVLGTGPVSLGGGILKVKDNGTANFQTITTGNGTTGSNVGVTASSTLDVNNNGANTNNAFVFNNLAINGSTLNVTGANGYVANFAGATNITGAAAFNPTTAQLDLLGKVTDNGNTVSITGTAAARLLNTAAGAAANANTGTWSVSGGNLLAQATANGASVPGSDSLGTATISLTGTNPLVHLAPSLGSSLANGTSPGVFEKGYVNGTTITSLATANFLGTSQAITGMPGNFAYLNTPAAGQVIANLPINAASTFNFNTAFQFTGLLNITGAGVYTFGTQTDDFGSLVIDGNSPIVSAVSTVTGTMYLTSGLHTFSYRAGNAGGNGTVGVEYQGPDQATLTTIPASAFVVANNPNDLAANFSSNSVSVAAGTSGTLDLASTSTIGAITFAGTGGTLNVTGSNNITTLTTGAVTTNGTSTLAPSTAILILAGVTGSAGGTDTLVLGGTSLPAASIGSNVTGVIADGAGGTLAVNKSGAGSWNLNNANTYSGGTTLTSGLLNLGNASALGTGPFTVAGGTLDNTSGSAMTLTGNLPQTWNADIAFAGTSSLNLGSGAVSLGTVAGATRTVTVSANTLTVGGPISSGTNGTTPTVSLTKAGAGTLVLAGVNTYTGTTTVNAGILQASGSGTFGSPASPLTLAAAGTADLNGTNQTVGALSNAGIITNTGNANSTLTVAGGTSSSTNGLKDGATNSLAVANTGGLTLSASNSYTGGTSSSGVAGSWVQLSNAGGAGTGAITLSANNGLLFGIAETVANNVTGAGDVENFNGTALVDTLTGNLSYTGSTLFRTAGSTIAFSPSADSTLSGPIGTVNASSYGSVATVAGGIVNKLGANKLTLTGTSVYTGATGVQAGTLALGLNGNLGATPVTVSSGATFAAIPGTSGATNAIGAATFTQSAGAAITMADGATSTLSLGGNAVFNGGTGSSLTFDIGGSATATDTITIAGTAAETGNEVVTINGFGTTGPTGGPFTLISAATGSTLAGGTYSLSSNRVVVNGFSYPISLTATATSLLLNVTGTSASPTAYFTGNAGNSALNATSGGAAPTNFSSDSAGNTDFGVPGPGSGQDVFFTATSGNGTSGPQTIASLGQNYTFNSLNFTSNSPSITLNNSPAFTLTLSGGGLSDASPNPQNVNVPLTLAAAQSITNTGGALLSVGGAINNGGFVLTTAGTGNITLGAMSGTGGFTQAATGVVTIAGADTATGTVNVAAGTLVVPTGGSINSGTTGVLNVGTTAGQNAVLSITGTGSVTNADNVTTAINIGPASNTASSIKTAGTLTSTGAAGQINVANDAVGNATNLYGALTITGGTVTSPNYIVVGGGGGRAVYNQSGGTVTLNANFMTIADITVGSGSGVANISGGTFTSNASGGGIYVGESGVGTLNVSGTAVVNAGNVTGAKNLDLGVNATGVGVVNLNGGTINTFKVVKGSGTGTFNFDGGTLAFNGAGTFTGLTNAYVYAGGGTISVAGNAVTVAQSLVAPAASGIGAVGAAVPGLSVSGGGYIDTPLVLVSGGNGTGAAAVASIDASGNLTGIVVTNPGTGYTTAPTFSLVGGGIGNTGAISGTATLVPNTGGLLTLTGTNTGVLTMSGTSTYTGGTLVTGTGSTPQVTLTTASALGTGTITLKNTGTNFTTLNLGANGTVSNPVTIDLSSARNGIQATGGSPTLAGPVTILGSNTVIFASNVAAQTFSLTGGVTAATDTGNISFRGSSGALGLVSTTPINAPSAVIDINGSANWTFAVSGNTWASVSMFNSGNFVLGINNAIPVTTNFTGQVNGTVVETGALDLNGFAQTLPGLNTLVKVTNNNATASHPSTLTLNLGTATVNDIGGSISNGSQNPVSLVVNGTTGVQSIGITSFTGGVTINGGTLSINGGYSANVAMATGANTLTNPYASANNLTLAGGTFQLVGRNNPSTFTGSTAGLTAAGTSLIVASSTGLSAGQVVTDTTTPANITPGTYITGINGTTLYLSQALPTTVGTTQALAFTNGTVSTAQTINSVTVSSSSTVNVQPGTGSGTTLTFNALAGSGNLTKTGTGPLQISGANTSFTGNTVLSAGAVQLLNQNALQASSVDATGTGTVVFDSSVSGNAFTLGGLKGSTNQVLANNAGSPAPVALTVGGNNQSNTYSGVLSDAGLGGSLIKTGSGTQTFTGTNSYSGGTTINGGTLLAGNAAAGTSAGYLGSGGVVVNSGGTLGGGSVGTPANPHVAGPVTVNAGTGTLGGTISAGTSTTTANLVTGNQTWTGGLADSTTGGTFAWKLNLNNNSSGATYADTGTVAVNTDKSGANWDQLTMSGLAITGNFNVQIIGITPTGTGGTPFNPALSYKWVAANIPAASAPTAASLVLAPPAGFSAFPNTNLNGFSASFQSESSSLEDIVISYNPAPEPTSLLTLGLGAAGLLLRRRRRVTV